MLIAAVVIGIVLGLCVVQVHYRVSHLGRDADDTQDMRAFRDRIRHSS